MPGSVPETESPTIRLGDLVAARCLQCPEHTFEGADSQDFENFKLKVHFMLDHPESSKGAAMLQYYMINMVILAAFKMIFSSVREWNGYGIWTFIEYWVGLSFIFEYAFRWAASSRKCRFFFQINNIIDFLAIIPFFLMFLPNIDQLYVLRLVRVARIFRLFKLSRHLKYAEILKETFIHAADALSLLGALFALLVVVLSVIMFNIELGTYDSTTGYYYRSDGTVTQFYNVPNTIYWCIQTFTLLGYGDIVPETAWGKFFTLIGMLLGLLLIAFTVSILASSFSSVYRNEVSKQKRLMEIVSEERMNQKPEFESRWYEVYNLHQNLQNRLEAALSDLKLNKADKRRDRHWEAAMNTISCQIQALLFDIEYVQKRGDKKKGDPVTNDVAGATVEMEGKREDKE